MSDKIQRHRDGHGLWCWSEDVDVLEAELIAMTEDRDLWRGQHNDDCPNKAEVERLTKIEKAAIAVNNDLPTGSQARNLLKKALDAKEVSGE